LNGIIETGENKMNVNSIERLVKARDGRTVIVALLAIALVLSISSSLGILSMNDIKDKLNDVQMKFEEGFEFIKSKSYSIYNNVKWTEIQAAGIRITETSLKGFLQLCERITLNFGSIKVYADVEARVMWVYTDPSVARADSEVYYVTFT
jgi:hypothetical protein